MASVQKSLRIPDETIRAIEELATESGLEFSAAANQLLEEAVRMRRCPGIVFTSGPAGRRATVAGTGVDIWEIIATYRSLNRNEKRLRKAYHWLTEPQIRGALAYYDLYPAEIERLLKQNDAWTSASVRGKHPSLVSRVSAPRKKQR